MDGQRPEPERDGVKSGVVQHGGVVDGSGGKMADNNGLRGGNNRGRQ